MILSSSTESNLLTSSLITRSGSSGFLTSFILLIQMYKIVSIAVVYCRYFLPLGIFMVKQKFYRFPLGQFFGNNKKSVFSFVHFWHVNFTEKNCIRFCQKSGLPHTDQKVYLKQKLLPICELLVMIPYKSWTFLFVE